MGYDEWMNQRYIKNVVSLNFIIIYEIKVAFCY